MAFCNQILSDRRPVYLKFELGLNQTSQRHWVCIVSGKSICSTELVLSIKTFCLLCTYYKSVALYNTHITILVHNMHFYWFYYFVHTGRWNDTPVPVPDSKQGPELVLYSYNVASSLSWLLMPVTVIQTNLSSNFCSSYYNPRIVYFGGRKIGAVRTPSSSGHNFPMNFSTLRKWITINFVTDKHSEL